MRSHRCLFPLRRLAGPLAGPLLVPAILALLLHAGARLDVLPPVHPVLDVDRTILVHQAMASGRPSDASVVLIGDSSCLMNVDAPLLARELGVSVLNLGTLSYLDLDSFLRLLERHLSSRRDPPLTVALLVHPDFVRRGAPSQAHVEMLENYLEGRESGGSSSWRDLLGLTVAEERLRSRLPVPLLPMDYRIRYGFSSRLFEHMERSLGTAEDPGSLDPGKLLEGSRDYHVAAYHRRQAARWAGRLPAASRLRVGLSPLPESFVEGLPELQESWTGLFEGAEPLSGLPETLPDSRFASRAHLRPESAPEYTRILARVLSH